MTQNSIQITKAIVNSCLDIEEFGDALSGLASVQQIVSGLVPGALDDDVKNSKVAETAFAMVGEIFEMAQELGWKSWKTNKELTDKQKVKIASEFADILAFLGMMMVLINKRTGITPDDIAEAYGQVCQKNINRFYGVSGEEGYENIVGKNVPND